MEQHMKEIDNIWGIVGDPKCKTAMLILTMMVFFAALYAEVSGGGTETLKLWGFTIIAYWTGRTSKAQENRVLEGKS